MRLPVAETATCSAPCSGLAPWTLLGATLILVAGFTDGARTWFWLAALACTYVGAALSGSTGWQLHPLPPRGALRPRGDHRARRGVHLDRYRRDRDRHRAGRGRGRDPRAPRRNLFLARLLRFLLDPRRADTPRPRGRGAGGPRSGRVRVRAFPDGRRHRALRVRDEEHRRTRRRGAGRRHGLCALRRERALLTRVLGDPDAGRTAGEGEPRPLLRRARALTRSPARHGRPGTRGAGARHRRLAGVARVRARVVG